jgi:hypothetical protein
VNKLSVASVQQKLLEAGEYRKVQYDRMKANARMHAIGSLGNPSTQITAIKQVKMPPEANRKSETHPDFVLQAEMAGNYVDKMGRGIFEVNSDDGAPRSTPSVKKMTPNQKTRQTQVTPDMQKGRKSGDENSQLWPAAEMAGHYVDAQARGNIYSEDNGDGGDRLAGGVKEPPSKNLHGTTRPKSSKKTADMTRWPHKEVSGPTEPPDSWPMPKDAPPKRSVDHIKSGVLVRVNESVKAKFDIVSTKVLQRIAESYKRFGYRVVFESSNQAPAWKSDKAFLRLVHEAVAAKENHSDAFHTRLTNAAWNRLYQVSQRDYNAMYESRDAFLMTIRKALGHIMESATRSYRKGFNLFIGQARVVAEGKMADVEIISEAIDHQMALRLIRNKLLEQFGLDTDIKSIFIDGTKYNPMQIREWVPVQQVNEWISQTGVDKPGHKGALHRALHVPQGQTIPAAKLKRASNSSNSHTRHMAQFAHNANE